MENNYLIEYKSPFVSGNGLLHLTEKNGRLNGHLSIGNQNFILTNGIKDQNNFQFTGMQEQFFGNFSYMVKGTIEGNAIRAKIHTALGLITARGMKVQ